MSGSTASPLRLVLMGTGPFAVPTFEALRAAGHEIACVVTRPQPAVRSRSGPPPSPVRSWAESHGLAIFDPDSINTEESISQVAQLDSDLLVVCDYGQILKPAALGTARLGGINLHGSLLPKFRGAAPVQRALLSGEQVTGVTVIHMTPKLDGGPVVTARTTAIADDETSGQLEERLAILGVEATLEAIARLQDWDGQSPLGSPQDPSLVTRAPRLQKSDGEIDWGRTAREIDCHVRGMQPWPVAFTHLRVSDDKPAIRLAIKEIRICDEASGQMTAGQIATDSSLVVATGDRRVEIVRLQPAGKKEMSGIEFLRGHKPAAGAHFIWQREDRE